MNSYGIPEWEKLSAPGVLDLDHKHITGHAIKSLAEPVEHDIRCVWYGE